MQCGWPHRRTYSCLADDFPSAALVVPAALVAAVLGPYGSDAVEYLWCFSLVLEAVAVVPQLRLLQRMHGCDALSSHFIFTLGCYRALYIASWIERAATEDGYWQPFVWSCGAVQVALYGRFFYSYCRAKLRARRLDAPILEYAGLAAAIPATRRNTVFAVATGGSAWVNM